MICLHLIFTEASFSMTSLSDTCGNIFSHYPPEELYLTDFPEKMWPTIQKRKILYTPNLRQEWAEIPAEFTILKTGEEILKIQDFEVMRGFEQPYMRELAKEVVKPGGKILNVGFGLGMIDTEIEKYRLNYKITEHHIIELNKDVFDKANEWKNNQKQLKNIYLHQGDWIEILSNMAKNGERFDGIIYDAFPLEEKDLHRDFIPFLKKVIDLRLLNPETGIITFYVDSTDYLGERFKLFAKNIGFSRITTRNVKVNLPKKGTQYWENNYFIVPVLSELVYE